MESELYFFRSIYFVIVFVLELFDAIHIGLLGLYIGHSTFIFPGLLLLHDPFAHLLRHQRKVLWLGIAKMTLLKECKKLKFGLYRHLSKEISIFVNTITGIFEFSIEI